MAARVAQRLPQAVDQQDAVRQSGQRVLQRLAARLALRLRFGRDVAHGAAKAQPRATGSTNWPCGDAADPSLPEAGAVAA